MRSPVDDDGAASAPPQPRSGCAGAHLSPEGVTRGTRGETLVAIPCGDREEPLELVDGEQLLVQDVRRGRPILARKPVPNNAVPASIAQVDWLAFTIRPGNGRDVAWLRAQLQEVFNLPADAWRVSSRGWMGYTQRIDLGDFGLSAHGGERQRGTMHVELNAQACALVADWEGARAWGESLGARIMRLDLAHDDFEGLHVNIDIARAWYEGGQFNANGRPPRAKLIDDCGSGEGKTLYIGARENGKLARLYEKGKAQGDPQSPWFRVEVEWRSRSRLIPWDALVRPGQYLAGAYPCLQYLSAPQEKIRTIQKAVGITYQQMVRWVRTYAGKSLNVMTHVYRGDCESVLREVLREGVPKRLQPFSAFVPKALLERDVTPCLPSEKTFLGDYRKPIPQSGAPNGPK